MLAAFLATSVTKLFTLKLDSTRRAMAVPGHLHPKPPSKRGVAMPRFPLLQIQRQLLWFFSVATLFVAPVSRAAQVYFNTDGFVAAIDGLSVAGDIYDVTFHYDVDNDKDGFDDIFGTGDPPSIKTPTFYYDREGAKVAAQAMIDLLYISYPSRHQTANNYLIVPTQYSNLSAAAFYYDGWLVASGASFGEPEWWGDHKNNPETMIGERGWDILGWNTNDPGVRNAAVAEFTAVTPVPEPASFIGCVGLASCAFLYRRWLLRCVSESV